jgi:hypothetical protein
VHGATYEIAFTVHGEPFRLRAQLCEYMGECLLSMRFVQLSPRTQQRLEELVTELEECAAEMEAFRRMRHAC